MWFDEQLTTKHFKIDFIASRGKKHSGCHSTSFACSLKIERNTAIMQQGRVDKVGRGGRRILVVWVVYGDSVRNRSSAVKYKYVLLSDELVILTIFLGASSVMTRPWSVIFQPLVKPLSSVQSPRPSENLVVPEVHWFKVVAAEATAPKRATAQRERLEIYMLQERCAQLKEM